MRISPGRSAGLFPLAVYSSVVVCALSTLAPAVDSLQLSPTSCCDGLFVVTTVSGERVWQNRPGHSYLYFNVPSSFTFTRGVPVHVQVTYHDEGHGTILVQYDSDRGNALPDFYFRSETHTRSTRVGGGAFVSSYHELLMPRFAGRQNGNADFRIHLTGNRDVPLAVRSVTIQNSPFQDSRYQYVLSKPWLSPHDGPTRNDVDRSTLEHKVMVGYQGWFRAPNDLADRGWVHWCRDGVMDSTRFTIDQWPDLTGYCDQELFRAGDVETRSGKPAHVFSSTTRETVRRHFRWMRKYDIDGAFLQRFATKRNSGAYGHDEWVLHHVREAANLEGRIWAIEYDVSALDDAGALEVFTTDWKWLVDTVGILDDSRYAHEGGKPVVFVWGLSFPSRGISKATANAIVDFFKNDPAHGGNYVIGGVPWWWRTMDDWNDHFQRYDAALAWMPPNRKSYADDFAQLDAWGLDSFPHVWPGFSWANLKRLTGNAQLTPRDGGDFFWQKIHQALGSGSRRLFIGMFDEYDEGTAIMPMSDDPPDPPPNWGRFITNDGRPSDWWMLLAGAAREMLLGHRPYSSTMPTPEELANRSNVGAEASVDLGATDRTRLLSLVEPADGTTSAVNFAGRETRTNADPATDLYYYFDVDGTFASEVAAGLDVTIEIVYHDRPGNVELSLQYDGVGGPYTLHDKRITTRGSGQWRSVRFDIDDAYFGGRQNGGADFRIRRVQKVAVHIDRVQVTREVLDCNANGFPDECDIASGAAADCDSNGIPDECETAPELICPPDVVIQCSEPGGAVVEFTPTTGDGCGSTVTCSPASGSLFPVGTTTVTCSASDPGGNGVTCNFEVRVLCSRQVPSDCNQDDTLDISDAICTLGVMFLGNPRQFPCGDGPAGSPGNMALLDWQPDGSIDISDAIAMLTFLFGGGPPHPLAVPGQETNACVPIPGCPDICRT